MAHTCGVMQPPPPRKPGSSLFKFPPPPPLTTPPTPRALLTAVSAVLSMRGDNMWCVRHPQQHAVPHAV